MSDNKKRKGPEDPKRININQPWERGYWCGKLDCTPKELRAAVTLALMSGAPMTAKVMRILEHARGQR